ncbi:two-component system OmpR family response regulator [Haloferula luteola]|uniref:Two-component system OmpR family response regulator n=1 Tax=Haloferula luteola TaxID=595692 RepID=A0A840V1C6_9BACT|nr:response regulator transcription factor [Haloferula luteola]MBB5351802.1 two-component system OmpR family response regulator [Haloferula luteola]
MKILVVEDEPRLLYNLSRALREEGYVVEGVPRGDEGLHQAMEQDFDAIVLDVMLPGLDGWEVLERLRRKKETPVLMLTARDALPDRVRGLDAGADDYLVKPFDLPELLARLRAVIRRHAGKGSSVIELGDTVVDLKRRQVLRDGEGVSLTAREYAIVEFLAMHRGRLVTRTELYERVFDENADTLSNVIDVHVFAIRKKLRPDLIVTRRGQGYCIE